MAADVFAGLKFDWVQTISAERKVWQNLDPLMAKTARATDSGFIKSDTWLGYAPKPMITMSVMQSVAKLSVSVPAGVAIRCRTARLCPVQQRNLV
jgi:hypothetical protein